VFLPLNLPEPPADVIAAVLDELRTARRELADAERIVHMLDVDDDDPSPRRRRVERLVARRRVELWHAEVTTLAQRARTLGLDVTATL
jgi:hypothetical protein